ncbi:MAG: lactate utilization protein [Thiothrix sp.]|nr:lactate utilization protein [Thiothrix sp.]HPQ94476.1 lactate utilization protein [Thiolinea sp.]
MNKARDNILQRLRAQERPPGSFPGRDFLSRHDWPAAECLQRFTERLQAVRAEVHHSSPEGWLELLVQLCRDKNLNNLLLSPQTRWGQAIYAQAGRFPKLQAYEHPIEDWKPAMFHGIDASLTGTLGGIAETGSLILWPDAEEPRQMSLVPPVHFALLEAGRIYSTFAEAIARQDWVTKGMPTNALLISGPSKSADIAQVLAYGVHGPKELVVLVV